MRVHTEKKGIVGRWYKRIEFAHVDVQVRVCLNVDLHSLPLEVVGVGHAQVRVGLVGNRFLRGPAEHGLLLRGGAANHVARCERGERRQKKKKKKKKKKSKVDAWVCG